MTRARKRVSVRRRLARLGRPVLAVGLLAALGWAAIQGVHRSADATDNGRLADRLQVTRAAATSMGAWLDAGVAESAAVSADAARVGAGQAAATYARHPHTFREVFIVDRALRRADPAANPRYAASDGSILACRDATGAVLDDGLRQLAEAALRASGPVMRAFDDPSCSPVIAAATSIAGGSVAIAVADRSSLLLRLDALSGLANGRAIVLEPGRQAVGAAVAPVSDELKTWVASLPAKDGAARVPGQGVVRAWAPLPAGWTLVIEQGANEFGGGATPQSSNWFPAAVAACFAFAIVVVGIFDARRRRALARADVDRAAFLGIVGHELRTPLTVLKGFIDTLTARWDGLEDGQRLSLLERLAPQVRRLHRSVDRLLVAADIQRGSRPVLEDESVDVEKALRDVAEGFRPLAPLHRFVVEAEPGLSVKADHKALGQALDQLVDNAVKYSPSGGLVGLRAVRRHGHVDVTVEDEGVGLPSDASRIFEAFTEGEDVERRTLDEGGIGVGLFIVRTLVNGMGGTVHAERRTPEPGTRLVVTLIAGPSRSPGGEQLARSARVHGPS